MDDQHEPAEPPDDDEQRTGSAQAPRAVSGGSRRMLLLGIAVFLCVIGAGVAAAVFSSPGGSEAGYIVGPAPSGSHKGHVASTGSSAATKIQPARSAAPSASRRATTGADVTSDGIARSALQWPPQLKRQMLRWWAGSGGASLTAVNTQMGQAMQAAGLKLYPPMRLACASLASDISTAQAGPPIPYGAMQRLYARALDGLSGAAADCRTAISVHTDGDENMEIHLDKVRLNRSRADFAKMSKKLYSATAEIQALSR